jgi:hypothetical protein
MLHASDFEFTASEVQNEEGRVHLNNAASKRSPTERKTNLQGLCQMLRTSVSNACAIKVKHAQ